MGGINDMEQASPLAKKELRAISKLSDFMLSLKV